MNKLQALNWLIENVTRWPAQKGGIASSPKGWAWGQFYKGDIQLFKLEPTIMYADCHISQQEWLDGEVVAKSNPKKIYIAGPMTGYENFNREAFNSRAEQIAATGDIAINPAILPDGLSQAEYMQICLAMVQCADAIYLLEGWDESKGAMAELSLAEKLGLQIIEE